MLKIYRLQPEVTSVTKCDLRKPDSTLNLQGRKKKVNYSTKLLKKDRGYPLDKDRENRLTIKL